MSYSCFEEGFSPWHRRIHQTADLRRSPDKKKVPLKKFLGGVRARIGNFWKAWCSRRTFGSSASATGGEFAEKPGGLRGDSGGTPGGLPGVPQVVQPIPHDPLWDLLDLQK